ncbi:STAS domain-containing protein [Streptomyces flavofungini]|uniref:STAS domain-containing protein n=1 Tax=Streptomyces flavofungini TaxID=68200 RepID=UPI0025AF3F5C|nr:STAS domain-containing protein [Streptomyces flavofungini]WJV50554.1 STAS domain-containing protein [Streptomyces flavofungini]
MAPSSPLPLHVDVVAGLDPALVRVRGDLDVASVPVLRAALAPLLHRQIELDLTEVSFIDSSGINALLAHLRHCRLAGGDMTVPHASAIVWRLLQIVGVESLLTHPRKPPEPGGPSTDF